MQVLWTQEEPQGLDFVIYPRLFSSLNFRGLGLKAKTGPELAHDSFAFSLPEVPQDQKSIGSVVLLQYLSQGRN